MTDWSAREQKAKVRRYQLDVSGPRKSALFLPGWDDLAETGCLCISEALSMGTIDRDTYLIAVERDPSIQDKIASRLQHFKFSSPVKFFKGDLANLLLDRSIEFAMLDLLGTLGDDLVAWITLQLKPNLRPGACLSFTFTQFWRNNLFMTRCSEAWQQPKYRKLVIEIHEKYGIRDWNLLLHFLILKSVFWDFSFAYRKVHRYRDNVQTMCAFRLDNFQPNKESTWPSLYNVLNQVSPTRKSIAMPTKNTAPSRTTIAKKAWKTRRKNAKDRAAMLSERALKAWETRRTNGWVHPASR